MRKILILLLGIIAITSSCQKEDDPFKDEEQLELIERNIDQHLLGGWHYYKHINYGDQDLMLSMSYAFFSDGSYFYFQDSEVNGEKEEHEVRGKFRCTEPDPHFNKLFVDTFHDDQIKMDKCIYLESKEGGKDNFHIQYTVENGKESIWVYSVDGDKCYRQIFNRLN